MTSWWAKAKANPVRTYAIIVAILTVLHAFGLVLSPDQRASLLGLAAVVLGGGEAVHRYTKGQEALRELAENPQPPDGEVPPPGGQV